MENKKYLSFELDNKNYKIRQILNQDFLELELWMVADHNPNNNNSHFTLESMKEAIPTFYNKPILGSFYQMPNEQDGDFGGHDSEYTVDEETGGEYFDNSGPFQEVPLGLITESSKVEIVEGKDGANWIKANGFLWVKYCSKSVLTLLRKRKGKTKISVEVEVLESHEEEGSDIEHIDKFNFLGVTCLGSYPVKNAELLGLTGDSARIQIHEGIEGANAHVLNFSKTPKAKETLKEMITAYEDFEKKMNLKFNSSNQNETNTEKVSKENSVTEDTSTICIVENTVTNAVEGQDIYHPHPVNPENEDVPVIGYDDESSDSNSNNSTADSKETNSRKGKQFSMLTYNVKRQLLDSALSECIGTNYGEHCYGWVQDFSDVEVYFYLDTSTEADGTWVAPYTINMKTENGEEKVDNCVIDFASKERAVQTWKKYSEEDAKGTEDKQNMDKNDFNNDVVQTPEDNGITVPEHFDDRNTEAPHSGDDRGKAAPKSGDDRGEPKNGTHENHAEDTKEDKPDESNKETQDCGCDDDHGHDGHDGHKETEDKKVTKVDSEPAGGDKKVTKVTSSEEDAKETCSEGEKDTKEDGKDTKETQSKDDTKEDNCNYEAKFTQLSQDYVAMQKENEALKAMNVKFQSEIAGLNEIIAKFEAEKVTAQNDAFFAFAENMINSEKDLTDDCRKTMSEEVKAECVASKFSSEEEVKKFTITKIAMALYENRTATKNEASKKEFVQNIVKPQNVTADDSLTAKRKALEDI